MAKPALLWARLVINGEGSLTQSITFMQEAFDVSLSPAVEDRSAPVVSDGICNIEVRDILRDWAKFGVGYKIAIWPDQASPPALARV